MTLYENVSVHEWTSGPKEGDRFIKLGKGDPEGADIKLATPENDQEELMQKLERERVLVFSLPEPMTKAETKEWLSENEPDPVYSALSTDE